MRLLVAIICSLIIAGPAMIFHFKTGPSLIGFWPTDEEAYYFGRVNSVVKGNFLASNPYVSQPSTTYVLPFLGELVTGMFVKFTGLDMVNISILGNFFLPLFGFLIYYWLLKPVFKDNWVKLFFCVAVTVGTLRDGFLPLTRPINPQFAQILLVTFMILIFRKNAIWATLISALLAYTNIYDYIFSIIVMALYFVFNRSLRTILASAAIFIAVDAFFLINYVTVHNLPLYGDVQNRYGFYLSRQPVVAISILISLFLFWKLKSRWPELSKYNLLFLGSYLIAINNQIVTGVVLQPGHWTWFILPICLTFAVASFLQILRLRAFVCLAIILLLLNAIWTQGFATRRSWETMTSRQDYNEVVNWLHKNGSTKDVILSNNLAISEVLLATTPAQVLLGVDSYLYLYSDSGLDRKYFLHAKLRNIYPVYFYDYFIQSGGIYIVRGLQHKIPQNEEVEVTARYRSWFTADFASQLQKEKVNTILIDKTISHIDLSEIDVHINQVVKIDDRFQLYRL